MELPRPVLWAVAAAAAALAWFEVVAFIEGRPLTGRTGGSSAREAWKAYGEGAFAAESAIHLLFAVALVVFAGFAVLTTLQGERLVERAAPIALVLLAAGAVASMVLLIDSTRSGRPFNNFQSFGQMEGVLYMLVLLIPLMVLAGVALGARELLKRRRARRAEAGL